MRILKNDADLEDDIQHLGRIEPLFQTARAATGPIALIRQSAGYGRIMRAIVGQQISVAAAEGVWRKMEAHGFHELEACKRAREEELRAVGLSRQKASYIKALAEAEIDFDGLEVQSNDEVIKELTAVKGIGVWTAEIYLMFSLHRADVVAAGDLALQESARQLFSLETRPTPAKIRKMAEDWSPYRTAASRLLWAYYHVLKGREGI